MFERLYPLAITVFLLAPRLGAAQIEDCPDCKAHSAQVAQVIKQADRLHAEFKPREAAVELQKVLQVEPRNIEALAKLSRAHIDIGDSISESSPDWREQRIREYRRAETYARQAIKADPNSTWGYFYVAASLGTMAGLLPVAKQIEIAEEIRGAAEKAIALDPQNGFAYHALGVWHRRMAEIGEASRVVASIWYGRSLPKGDLDKSVEFLKKAVSLNPNIIVSRLELARSYAAREEWAEAMAQLKFVADLPIKFSDDAQHKKKGQELMEEIKNRQAGSR
jgi:tetratricopeptide (TPR) repeat protein